MPHFMLFCRDKPDSLELRMANREKHLAYVGAAGDFVRLGGPLLEDDGSMAGSLLVVEADDLAAVEAFAAEDPYNKAGLFESVTIKGFKVVKGDLG